MDDRDFEHHYNISIVHVVNTTLVYEDLMDVKLQPEAIIVPLICVIIFVSGVLGNICLLYHEAHSGKRHTYENIFIANLAIGDLLVLIFAIPYFSTNYTVQSWPYGEVICKVSYFAMALGTTVIILTLVGLTIAIAYKPAKRDKLVGIWGIWFFSVLLSMPDLISPSVLQFSGYNICLPYPNFAEYATTFDFMKFLIVFIFPIMMIASFRLHVLVASKNNSWHRTPVAHFTPRGQGIDETRENPTIAEEDTARSSQRQGHIVFILVLIFIACWMPRYIYVLWFHFHPGNYNMFWHYFKIVSFCMMVANPGINPVVFYVLDVKFRIFIVSCTCRKSCRKPTSINEDVSDFPPKPAEQTVAIKGINKAVRIEMA